MKRLIFILLVLLFFAESASALTGTNYPAFESGTVSNDQMGGIIDDTSLLLEFDPSTEYSFLKNGSIQACFYAYNTDRSCYVELYMVFPEAVSAGTVIDPKYCLENNCTMCSITLDEVGIDSESFYTAFSLNGDGYPSGTDYHIQIESCEKADGKVRICGTLTARLNRVASNMDPTADYISIQEAQFSFSIPASENSTVPETPYRGNDSYPSESLPAVIMPSVTPFAVKV